MIIFKNNLKNSEKIIYNKNKRINNLWRSGGIDKFGTEIYGGRMLTLVISRCYYGR